jgi:zinc/manganese transport system substrate-binding protein
MVISCDDEGATVPEAVRRTRAVARAAVAAVAVVVPLVLTSACAGSPAALTGGRNGRIDVVASTDVWGSVAAAVGGRWVCVTSLVDQPDQDPHSFEGSARSLLAVKEADLLIENGGGYDPFMSQLVDVSGTRAPVVDAVRTSGDLPPAGVPLNEHVWYDLPGTERVAHAIAGRLTALAPRHGREFEANVRRFDTRVDTLIAQQRAARAQLTGTPVAVTEPVALQMLEAMGLRNVTPLAFSDAVEEGGEVSVRVLSQMLDLMAAGHPAALVYNVQTESAVTEQVERAARDAGVPVVAVTETLPAGSTYVSWMRRNVAVLTHTLEAR